MAKAKAYFDVTRSLFGIRYQGERVKNEVGITYGFWKRIFEKLHGKVRNTDCLSSVERGQRGWINYRLLEMLFTIIK
jgi:hypothetical protein